MTENNKMREMPVYKLMIQMGIPMILSMALQAVYNIVDSAFVGNMKEGSEAALNALTLVFPVQMLMVAIAIGTGVGTNALLARTLGQGDSKKAAMVAGNSLFLGVIIYVICFLFGIVGVNAYISSQTANPEVLSMGTSYLKICCVLSFGIVFFSLFEKLLQATGRSLYSTIGQVAGAVINIILDPIFIFGLQWGMMGAAIATVIGQVVTAILAVWYLLHMRIIKPESGDYALSPNIFGRMLTLGITSFLSQISLVAAMAAINNMLRKYGALDAVFSQEQYAQIPMAVVGIVMKFFQIVISIVVGMAAGCIPIVGYNMGAEKTMRVRELFTRLLISEALVGAVALILAEGFPHQLIAIFGASNESSYYTDFAVKAFRTYLCMMIFACVNKACFIFLQAVGKALTSTMLSMFREVVFGVGFALLLPVFFGLDGVLYSMPVSDILTFIISAVIIIKTYHELNVKGA